MRTRRPADPILAVVPDSGELIAEAQLLSRDAGFVDIGQPRTVKLEAFPFTRYGSLEGKIARISRDAIQDEKLWPVYAARVTVKPPPKGSTIEVTPGLAASAEIRTDERRVIDYLFSPLERTMSEAERVFLFPSLQVASANQLFGKMKRFVETNHTH